MRAWILVLALTTLAGCRMSLFERVAESPSVQGGAETMYHCVTYDADTGRKTGEFWVSKASVDRTLGIQELEVNEPQGNTDVFSPCRLRVKGYDRTQGDTSLARDALRLEAELEAERLRLIEELGDTVALPIIERLRGRLGLSQ